MANLKISQVVSMRPELTVRPDLIQSLKLLMEPILTLEQVLRQNLSENPLLEEIEEEKEDIISPEVPEPRRKDDQTINDNKIDWQEYLGEDNEWTSGSYKDFSQREDDDFEHTQVVEKTLYDHLFEQLGYAKLTEEEIEIGAYIIGNIDESGFLKHEVETIAEELQKDVKLVTRVLDQIKKFDPPGIGSRDLRECLLAQLEEQSLKDSLVWELVDKHLYTLDKKSVSQLAKTTSTTPDRIQAALDIIRTLSPRPAQGRFAAPAAIVVPDLIVDNIDGEYLVFHNDKNLPRLRINQNYRSLIKRGNKTPTETKNYVREKLEQARWLINAINQRRSTMIKVMEAIVEHQVEFFEHGEDHLKPLTMEQIADIVGMNVATISRYFFNTGVSTSGGEDLSKRVVKNKIQQKISEENPAMPLSDQEIANILKEDGIQLARRTVTKYREELGIKSARFRKQTK
jgi:RNA polymerase sigma-54 factor